MGIQIERQHTGKLVPVRIRNPNNGLSSAAIKGISKESRRDKKKVVRGGTIGNFARRPIAPDFDSESESDVSERGISDPTLSALSNPNKTNDQQPESDGESEFGSDDSDGDEDAPGGIPGGDDTDDDTDDNEEGGGVREGKEGKNNQKDRNGKDAGYGSDDSDDSEKNSKMSRKEDDKLKAEYLSKFDRLRKKGIAVSKKFTMKSKLSDMQKEFQRLNRNNEVDSAIKFQRKALVAVLSGLEFINKKFDPFAVKLDGWTESVVNDIDEYDNVFERLYDKYAGSADVAPEIELMMMVAGSALMFHMSKSLFNNSNFNISDILKQNPDLMKNLMSQLNQGNVVAGSGVQVDAGGGGVSQNTGVRGESVRNVGGDKEAIIDDLSDRLSESSFDSDVTGVKSVSIRVDPKGNMKNKSGKPRKVMDINL